MSNTRKLNQRAAANRVKNASTSAPSRRLRGPSHGLAGDSFTQRRSDRAAGRPTHSLRHSQVTTAMKKGAAAHALHTTHATPAFRHSSADPDPAATDCNFNSDFHSNFPAAGIASDSDGESESVGEVESAVQDLRVEYRDYRTRRDRTHTSNQHWKEQLEEMTDAYIDWCLREKEGRPVPVGEESPMWVEVIDIFGKLYGLHNFELHS